MKVSIISAYNPMFLSKTQHKTDVQPCGVSAELGEITHKELYDEFKKGKRPTYVHLTDTDPQMKKLKELSERYKQYSTIKNKKVLLNHERKILYNELSHPELTLARNYNEISTLIPRKTSPDIIRNIITNMNLIGLARIERLDNPFNTRHTKKKTDLLNKLYENTDSTKPFGNDIIFNSGLAIDGVNASAKKSLYSQEQLNFKPLINKLKKNINQPEKLDCVLTMSNPSDKKEVSSLVEQILGSTEAIPEVKLLGVWGGGKYRSDKNFEILKNIALNSDEKDIRLREFALQSSALYLKEKPDEVIQIIDSVKNEDSIFSPLANILKDKITGNYHGQNMREYKYHNLSDSEVELIEDFKKENLYVNKLNTHKMNSIDMDLIQYREIMKKNPEILNKIAIINDTYTKIYKEETGKRNFTQGLYNSGNFTDSVTDLQTNEMIITNKKTIGESSYQSVIAHEEGHQLNAMFYSQDDKKLSKLYKKALKENRIMGDYAGRNESEYFATGCEAYATTYKPHKYLLTEWGLTKYTLMSKDPELYKFITKILKKY